MQRLNKTDYKLDDGRSVRITLTMMTPEAKLATANYLELDSVGYEINDDGTLVMDDRGAPIGITSRLVRIPLDGVRAGTQFIQPAWVPSEEREGDVVWDNDDADPDEGDVRFVDGQVERWTFGLYDAARTSRLGEFAKPEPIAAADNTAFLASLEP